MQQLRETITDTLLFTYYYLELENSKIPVLLPQRPALCIYFYPLPLTPPCTTNAQNGSDNIWGTFLDIGTIRPKTEPPFPTTMNR